MRRSTDRILVSHAGTLPRPPEIVQLLSQGASGAAGLSAALCAMETGMIPPTINLDQPDPKCDLDYVANKARKADVRIALCNCIGFGSKNSALVIEKIET